MTSKNTLKILGGLESCVMIMRGICKECKRLIRSSRLVLDRDGTPLCRDCAEKKYPELFRRVLKK